METFELYLTPINAKQFKAIVTKSPVGEGETESSLPFFEGEIDWRMTVLRTLEISAFNLQYFQTAGEQDWMVKSGILSKDISAFHPNYIANIGQELYKSLFPLNSKVKNALFAAQRVAESENKQLHIQLKIEADVVQRSRLTDYPWELLHDGKKFLLHQQITISRYIAYDSVPPNLAKVEQLNILLVSSSASDSELGLNPFKPKEQQAILKGLKSAAQAGYINFKKLDYATLNYLREYLTENRENNTPHVLHFDGHGLFGKRCSHCGAMNQGVKAATCRKCNLQLPPAQGYLVFEDENGDADYISAEELGTLLRQSSFGDGTNKSGGVTLTVLSACQSAMTFVGDSVFNGTAQNLISQRIPAVVAMQYSVGVEAATKFAEQFYRSLGQKNSLATAISHAQEAMGAGGNQWYRPVLYLRWRDNEGGQLFAVLKSATGIGIPFQAPSLPANFVKRPQVTKEIKARLLENTSNAGALLISAIHGLGGIGKTTLAAALAHDEDIKKRFSDGVLWATLGQEPDTLALLSSWVQALGDYEFRAINIEATSAHLRSLLYDKAVLLVVDDAWEPDKVKPFLVASSQSRLLITSRRADVANSVGADLQQLNLMTPEESLELFSNSLGREIKEVEKQEALRVAETVGYLPIALNLVAARVKWGITWAKLEAALKQEVANLKVLYGPRQENSLEATFNLSINALQDYNEQAWKNFIWLGVLPEDVTIAAPMAVTLWDMESQDEADERLELLWNDALLQSDSPVFVGGVEWKGYKIHDLLYDVARDRLIKSPPIGMDFNLPDAHSQLLERYWQKTQNNLWHTLPNDGYIHQNLVWHLEKAQRIEEIHSLLREESQTTSNGWFEAREKLGQAGGYITDISGAWKLAQANWTESTLPQVVGLQCRYALITASLNSLAANVPANLLLALVKSNKWTPEQGLAYALQNPKPYEKVNSLTKLVNYLPRNLQELALQKALAAARVIQDEDYRANALSALAEKLPNILEEALAAVRAIQSESNRANALSALAQKLPQVWPEALAAVRAIQSESNRANALSALADKLPDILPQALAAATAIQDDSSAAKALRLADKLPPELLQQALAAATAIQNESNRANALSALADKLPPELLPQALAAATAIQDESNRAEALRALADKLPDILPQALAAATAIQDESNRAEALRALADKLPDILPQALAAATAIQDEYSRANALSALADKLPPELLPQALAAATAIQFEYSRAEALSALADKLPPELLPQALAAATAIQFEYSRAEALSALAKSLSQMLTAELFPLWQDTLYELSLRTRRDLLQDIKALFPVIFALGGKEATAELARAIVDVARWWR
ncbi:NB-ARC domain-containing protein [Nostoc sp. LPT]|uniref:NB-ARC domain-containing protein n=1 Tax=Nostoc sp. LPT TaxID=2815387 RepID=UPI001DD266D9|nr:NB-ARC domain-containing protein [Nostoc sp. LPT]MBN4005992.1 CHAT domain-containing protein [Nostoc sp. LPT]